jgi:hypothetical protein
MCERVRDISPKGVVHGLLGRAMSGRGNGGGLSDVLRQLGCKSMVVCSFVAHSCNVTVSGIFQQSDTWITCRLIV